MQLEVQERISTNLHKHHQLLVDKIIVKYNITERNRYLGLSTSKKKKEKKCNLSLQKYTKHQHEIILIHAIFQAHSFIYKKEFLFIFLINFIKDFESLKKIKMIHKYNFRVH